MRSENESKPLLALESLRGCMVRALKLDPAAGSSISASTTAADLPGWTSVAHLALVLELEKTFGVRLDNAEIVTLASVPAILERLAAKGVQA